MNRQQGLGKYLAHQVIPKNIFYGYKKYLKNISTYYVLEFFVYLTLIIKLYTVFEVSIFYARPRTI